MAENRYLDETHSPDLKCWVAGADGHANFPVQNLPLCVFSTKDAGTRGGVAIGDFILDLAALAGSGLLSESDQDIVRAASGETLNTYCALSANERQALRRALSRLLTTDDAATRARAKAFLIPQSDVAYRLPAAVGDYTDFFAGIHHARNAGKMFRPDQPLLPNYMHVPIAYHGRASSVAVSGIKVKRPAGQIAAHGTTEPEFGLTQRLDFELELAIWVGAENELGEPIGIGDAGDAVAGFGLLNDWSARDIQAWETKPLGPFLGKNFLTTVSPFLVTAEALAPFRRAAYRREEGDPAPMSYLFDEEDQRNGAFDINLEVLILTAAMREAGREPFCIAAASALDLIWTPAQMVAHHTATGCNLRPGDLFGTGTVSSRHAKGHGSLLELTRGGREATTLPGGETRTFLEDGDEVILRGWCERDGFVGIGLGEARGVICSNDQVKKS